MKKRFAAFLLALVFSFGVFTVSSFASANLVDETQIVEVNGNETITPFFYGPDEHKRK